MFLALEGQPDDPLKSQVGGLAVAVPGDVNGLCWILETYGTLDRATVLQPAIRLAREGFPLDQHAVTCQEQALADFERHPDYRQRFHALWTLYLNDGGKWSVGDRFHSPLAPALELIAREGAAAFHSGPLAKAIVAEVDHQDGILTIDDLAANTPVSRAPLLGDYKGYGIVTMPPPSSGGVAILQILNTLAAYQDLHPEQSVGTWGADDPRFVQLVVEAMKHAFADRAQWLSDADFASVPVERLISRRYAKSLAQRIDLDHTGELRTYGTTRPVKDGGTSHYCVIDVHGNAVAGTETINTLFGSYIVEPTYGIVLNNEMDDFAAVPGQPNAFGLVQSDANAIAPGKKPLSSMSPTILVKNGKAEVVAGASGGPRIITATLLTLLNMVRSDMPVDDAVAQPRYHHQWLPETLFVEPDLMPLLTEPMQARGHVVEPRAVLGAVQAARRVAAGVTGASDPRKGGQPAGH